LRAAIATLFRGSTCRVTLDDEDFAERRIFFLAVGEFSGKAGDVERAFPARHFTRFSRGFARTRRVDDLADDGFRLVRMFQQEFGKLLGDRGLDHALHFRRDQLFLGLRRKFRVG
jgi:hypothetical protein